MCRPRYPPAVRIYRNVNIYRIWTVVVIGSRKEKVIFNEIMKLMCNVEISNRLLSNRQSGSLRKQKSCLAIGRQSVKSDDLYLLLQTATNKSGFKYRVNSNIEKVFTRFLDEGKVTIRLKNPAIDLNIQCDAVVQLKSFLHVLKLGLSKKLDPAVLDMSNLNPKSFPTALKTKVVIKQVSNYPILEGFPRTTEQLILAGLERRSFDRQILKLQSLRVLNLSENQLTSLPQELGTLPNLKELNVANNQLGKSPISKWTWLSGKQITKTLQLLNLSFNQITGLPKQINKLHSLVTLYLNNNFITYLPEGIGNLNRLKYLNLSMNSLQFLPGSMKNLRLSELDISDNTFDVVGYLAPVCRISVPTFVDLAARVILQARIYYDASIIPYTLVYYLDNAHFCLCGAPCFNTYIKRFMTDNPSAIAHSIHFSGTGRDVLFECYFCSIKCLRKYVKTF